MLHNLLNVTEIYKVSKYENSLNKQRGGQEKQSTKERRQTNKQPKKKKTE